MTYNEISEIVTNEHNKPFVATFSDGSKKTLRLWNNDGVIGVMNKGAKRWGHRLEWWADHYDKWASLSPVEKTASDMFTLYMKRARKAHKMLCESGLWPDIKDELAHFLSLDEGEQRQMVSDIIEDSYTLFYSQHYEGGKYSWVGAYQIFETLAKKTCFKSIAYHKWDRENRHAMVEKAIREKTDYRHRWEASYDNTLEVQLGKDGKLRGWYSEEYRGCGNGHYYLLFDATHAIFYEDD